jgi:hypothetical protein
MKMNKDTSRLNPGSLLDTFVRVKNSSRNAKTKDFRKILVRPSLQNKILYFTLPIGFIPYHNITSLAIILLDTFVRVKSDTLCQ